MNFPKKRAAPLLLIGNEQTRSYLLELLQGNAYLPIVLAAPQDLQQALKKETYATVFLDCEVAIKYGGGLYAKIKVGCRNCRIVLLCDKRHKSHRGIIRQAMDIGIYSCLLAPYEDWEVLTMVKHYPRLSSLED
jgi:DNA-binding NtrC family response regulator